MARKRSYGFEEEGGQEGAVADFEELPVFSQSRSEGPNETVKGGQYVQGARRATNGKVYGGRIVNANGRVLAKFKDDQINTGRVEDGEQPSEEEAGQAEATDDFNSEEPSVLGE